MAQSRAQLEAQLPPDFRSGFSWFIEGKLAHMTWPEDEEIDFLNDQGIKMLVNLTDEDTSYRPIAEFFDIKCAKYSIPDHHPLGVDRVGILQLENLNEINSLAIIRFNWSVLSLCVCVCAKA